MTAAHPVAERVHRQRLAHVVALAFVAVQRMQQGQHGFVLHAFGHHRQAQVVRQVDGAAHDLGVAGVLFHRHH